VCSHGLGPGLVSELGEGIEVLQLTQCWRDKIGYGPKSVQAHSLDDAGSGGGSASGGGTSGASMISRVHAKTLGV
jgi:hypothetical protein